MNTKNICTVALSLAASLTLAACGGGGGGSTATAGPGAPAPATAPAAPAGTSTIITSAPPATYPAASPAGEAYVLLNAERTTCGFGVLAENTHLDQAALAHANWLLVNNYTGHYESASVPNGYTGVAPQDRGVAAGYVYSTQPGITSGEILNQTFGANASPVLPMLRTLLAAPYHGAGAISGWIDVGVGYLDAATAGSTHGPATVLNIDFGVPSTAPQQYLGGSDVLTYPCQGTTGTATGFNAETPDPVPGRNLATNPLGQAIQVQVRYGQTLAITSATMTNMASGAAVALLPPVTATNDVNSELDSNQGFILPNAPLTANTSYQVTVTGTNNGVSFSRTFSFTTGS